MPILSIYATPLISILAKTTKSTTLSSLNTSLKGHAIFDENAALRSGLIEKKDIIPSVYSSFIFSSPHFYVGTPIYKQPNRNCKSKGDYSHIDLQNMPNDFIPRAIFKLTEKCSPDLLKKNDTLDQLSKYRLAWRTWVSSTNERTLITCIIPPRTLTIYPVFSMAFSDYKQLAYFAGLTSTIIYDFMIRITGTDHIWEDDLIRLPFPHESNQNIISEIIRRTAQLQCITSEYSKLWEYLFKDEEWHIEHIALSHKQRRIKFIELEVLTAMLLDIRLEELILLYKIQFPTLMQYEEGTYYDRNGRIIYTNNKNLNNVGIQNKEWELIYGMKNGEYKKRILLDDNYKAPKERVITYVAPFERCDREADYATAWAAFEKRGKPKE